MPSGAHLTSLQFNKQRDSNPPRNQYLTPSTARNEQPEGERGPEQPEDEWGITDDDGSGGGGSKEDYEDFDFEGDDW